MKKVTQKITPAIVVIVLIFCGLFYYYKKVYIPQKQELSKQKIKIVKEAREFIIKNILLDEFLIINENQNSSDIMAKLPIRFDTGEIKKFFENFIAGYKNVTLNFYEMNNIKKKQAIVELLSGGELIFKARFIRNSKPKIALILDDWGYNSENFTYLETIKYPFAISIFPNHSYSKKAAIIANKNRKLVMLHLPMEPKRKLPLEKQTIKVNMSEEEIKFILDNIFASLPFISGVNNHQGSLATTDERVMDIVMKILKEKNVFFIDSLTDSKSVAFSSAVRNKLPTNKRDVFIDNKKEVKYNEGQIELLKKIARKKGYAIGIGHDDPITLQVLQKNMPILESEGYEFVYITEVLL